ncbi:MAG TPA: IS1595 family transposase [Longimicrobium sp.]
MHVASLKSPIIDELPLACSNETAAVEFFEAKRWPDGCACIDCGSVNVYQMKKAKSNERQAQYRWRCRDCNYQFTVRTGTIFEDSPLPLRKWAMAFWMFACGKKGCAALELQRVLQISYKSALFMAHRIRFAMEDGPDAPRLDGVVEVDEVYIGGKPRKLSKQAKEKLTAEGKEIPKSKRGAGTSKVPVVAAVQRDGKIRRRVIANITADNLKDFLKGTVQCSATIVTDENAAYPKATADHAAHHTVQHNIQEYARTDKATGLRVHTNTAEGSHSLLRRSITGTWHRISLVHMHRYLAHCDFLWNTRKQSDGDRVLNLIRSAEGKRLFYRTPLPRTA